MCPEDNYSYEGNIDIIVRFGNGEGFRVSRKNAKVEIQAHELELPDKADGYLIHKLRKEEILTIHLVTHDNWKLLEKPPEIDEDLGIGPMRDLGEYEVEKPWDRNEYFGDQFPD